MRFTVVVHSQPLPFKTKYMTSEQVQQIIESNTSDGLMSRKEVIDWLEEHYGIDVEAMGITA